MLSNIRHRFRHKSSGRLVARKVETSPRVFSYYTGSRKRLDEEQSRRQKSTSNINMPDLSHLVFGLSAVVVIVCLIYLSLLSRQAIVAFDDQTPLLRASATYQQKTDSYLGSRWFDGNKLTFGGDMLCGQLKSYFPEIKTCQVIVPILGKHPRIRLTMRRAALELATDNNRYIVADDGTVLMPSSIAKPGSTPDLPLVQDEASLPVTMGKPVLSAKDITFIRATYMQLTASKLGIEQLSLPKTGRDLIVRLKGAGYYARMLMERDASEQTGMLVAAILAIQSRQELPAQYIDVRVDERVYYR